MLEITGVVAGVIVAIVAVAGGVSQVARWIWQRGYKAGRSDAYQEAEHDAHAKVTAEVQNLIDEVQNLRKLLDEK
jgi:flagellar biosynthesis/type III secretory pathway protein FliH